MDISYNNYLKNLKDDDVLEIYEQLLKSQRIKSALEESFGEPIQQRLVDHLNHKGIKTKGKREEWFNSGVDCKILQAGSSGWKSGKLKINVTVEFIPDPPPTIESPLDEIRREIQGS